MNTRTLTLCRSLRQATIVVSNNPTLSAAAAESKAFALFVDAVDQLEAMYEEHERTRMELRQLTARKRALIHDINLLIDCLHATVQLIPNSGPFAVFGPLSTRQGMFAFTLEARSIIDMTEREADAFINAGLHPQTFDSARSLIQQLVDVDDRASYADAYTRSYQERFAHSLEYARKRRQQVYLELRRAMTDESRLEWTTAAALGRTHRPKLLPAASTPALLDSVTA